MEEFIYLLETVLSVGLTGMRKTGCSGDLSCTYLSHHKLGNVKRNIVVVMMRVCNIAWRDGCNKRMCK